MPPLMSYRLIILNGERRGERVEVGPSALTIGSDPGCGLRLGDPDILPLHAELIPDPEGLQIRAGEEATVIVNGTSQRLSPLEHGDVVELGPVRFFIQASVSPLSWESLTGRRHLRITGGLLVILLAGGLIWWLLRDTATDTIEPAPSRNPAEALSNAAIMAAAIIDDNTVTGTPRIVVHPSVVPEMANALQGIARQLKPSAIPDLTPAREELEYATRFLVEHAASNDLIKTQTRPGPDNAELTRAEDSLRETPPPAVTNAPLPATGPDTPSTPAPDVKPVTPP